MPTQGAIVSPTPHSIAAYVTKNAEHVKRAQKHRHGEMESVREAVYGGHHIVVRTWYEVEVDGRMLMGHMGVTNGGQVHYEAAARVKLMCESLEVRSSFYSRS